MAHRQSSRICASTVEARVTIDGDLVHTSFTRLDPDDDMHTSSSRSSTISSSSASFSNLVVTNPCGITGAATAHGTVTVNCRNIASFSLPLSPSSSSSSALLRIRIRHPQDQAGRPIHVDVRMRYGTSLGDEDEPWVSLLWLQQMTASMTTNAAHGLRARHQLSAVFISQTHRKVRSVLRHAYKQARLVIQRTLKNGISKARRYTAPGLRRVRAHLTSHARHISAAAHEGFAAVTSALESHRREITLRSSCRTAVLAALAILVTARLTRSPPSKMPPWLPPLTLPHPPAVVTAHNGTAFRADIYKWLSFPDVAAMTNITPAWIGAPFPPPQMVFTHNSKSDSDVKDYADRAQEVDVAVGHCLLPTWLELRKHVEAMRRSTSTLSHPDKLAHLGLNEQALEYKDFIAAAYRWVFDALEYTLDVHEWRVEEGDWSLPALPRARRRTSGRGKRMDAHTAEARAAALNRELASLLASKPSPSDILASDFDRELAAAGYAATVPLTDRAWAKLAQDWLPCRGSSVWDSPLWGWVGAEELPARWGKTDVWPFLSPGAYAAAPAAAASSTTLEGCGVIGAINLFPPQLSDFSAPSSPSLHHLSDAPTHQQSSRRSFFGGTECLPEHRGQTEHLGGDIFFWRDVRRWVGAAAWGIVRRVGWETVSAGGEVMGCLGVVSSG